MRRPVFPFPISSKYCREFNRYFPRNRHPSVSPVYQFCPGNSAAGRNRGEKEKRKNLVLKLTRFQPGSPGCSFRNERRKHTRRAGSARRPSRVDSNLNCIIRSSRLASHVELKICSFPTCWDSLTGWRIVHRTRSWPIVAPSLSLSLSLSLSVESYE